jgi:DNA helicase-2/ATP-dependent DNA helicase PcrA
MITKVEQQAAFDKMMQGLNPAQKRAVDNMEGPVMVIAGPGTGKTQILGARIGKILLESDTRPENILCLTYTDAGVVAMRKRLLDFIGPDAYKVNLYTFHAFCNDIIQENLSLFEKTSLYRGKCMGTPPPVPIFAQLAKMQVALFFYFLPEGKNIKLLAFF